MKMTMFVALYLSVVLSAAGLVYSKHVQRHQFIELQALENKTSRLQTEWEQLLLEESAWSNQARIEQIANNKLDMHLLDFSDVVMLEVEQP